MITGISLVSSSRFSRVRTSQPSRSGNRMSRVMAAGRCSRALPSAWAPVLATSARKPAFSIWRIKSSAAGGSSSTTRTRARAALGRALACVGHAFAAPLLPLARTGRDLARGHLSRDDLDLLLGRERLHGAQRALDNPPSFDRLEARLHLARLDL